MLKEKKSLLDADPRNDQTITDRSTGQMRSMSINDLHDLMAQLELGDEVPVAIQQQFDLARHAFIYSWLHYEFVTLAEAQSYATLEMALRERVSSAGGDISRARGLKALYEMACKLGCLDRRDFEIPSPFNPGETMSRFEIIRMMRNDVMHGNPHLLPSGSLDMMHLCAEILRLLFPTARPLPSDLTK